MSRRIPTLLLILLFSLGISFIASGGVFLLFFYDHSITDFTITERDLPLFSAIISFTFTLIISLWLGSTWLARKRQHTLNLINLRMKEEAHARILIEESKQKLEIALLQGQKLQAIGTLAGGIAHDFNNILYAIKGYAEMLREDVQTQPLLKQNLDKVLMAAARGQELIARILAFSRKQHRDFQLLDLNETIEAALGLLLPTIPASVQLNFTKQAIATNILGDQTQLHQVVVNLINNSVDAMDSEGVINITLKHIKQQDDELLCLPKRLSTDYVCLCIQDHGHGMDQTTLERIFEPFFTTKEVGKGTGLGLSIAHSIISEHNGYITASSQLDTGTTFFIYLPLQQQG